MHRSSESIGAIAAALAKAQVELTNPEKSLIATLPSPGQNGRSFRYAALSSGLDIVRKCLGRHEIAAIQTTAIDESAGLIRLTTVLAHSSGEWVSSDWPVCPVAETAAPHRMGAALTYARRYALFTLVGIAGEDDLDAPDLTLTAALNGNVRPRKGLANGDKANNQPAQAGWPRSKNARGSASPNPILDAEQSAKLRDALAREIDRLASADDAAAWAHRSLKAKNALTADDANAVERAFADRLAAFAQAINAETSLGGTAGSEAATGPNTETRPVLQKVLRLRDREHRKFVARQPCLICGRSPSDPHHLRFAQPRALGRRVSDEYTVPLCRVHHRELHRRGDEVGWWNSVNVDPLPLALKLWRKTHFDHVELMPQDNSKHG
jgi:hypothetical protein